MKGNKTTHVKYQLVVYAVYMVGITLINIRLVKASMIPVNAPAAAQAYTAQVNTHRGIISALRNIDSAAIEREDAIRYANNMLSTSIQKYGKNTTASNNSNEKPERNLRSPRQTHSQNYLDYYYIIDKINKFKLIFNIITGLKFNDYLYNSQEHKKYRWFSSFQISDGNRYFEEITQKFVINNDIKKQTSNSSELFNILSQSPKIIDLPILSARMHEYYPFIKEDFKDMIETDYKIKNPNKQKSLLEEYGMNDEQVAAMFLGFVFSPKLYTPYSFKGITKYKNSKDFIDKIVDYSTLSTITSSLNDLKEGIDKLQENLTMFISDIFYEISNFGIYHPKFNVTKERVYVVSNYYSFGIDLRNHSKRDSELKISQLKKTWKIISNCFAHQLSGVLKLIQNISNIETTCGLKDLKVFLHNYTSDYTINDQYFKKMDSILENTKKNIANVNTCNVNVHDVNSMFDEIMYLATTTMDLLNLILESFENKIENLHEYNLLTNKTNPLYPQDKSSNELSEAMKNIESYVDYIQRVAKYANAYIGVTGHEMYFSRKVYTMDFIKELSSLPSVVYISPNATKIATPICSYTSAASQLTFNALLSISTAGTYVFQKLFFLR
ncbi:hypothetical protein NEIRO03_0335 [Nematocida sp. AWRm78]|nr:hypothetical protein NEIRO02_0421 [Nematocida sp. AWRm79]KAI5182684.1 hypothetical protein NEIRO03_0335 [Nematocida sp. AWRm78]